MGLDDAERSEPRGRRIPEATVVRLPIYQRILSELLRSGAATVSSEQLASLARVNAAKVRKDLSLLGSFGTRGTGYDAAFLISQIDRALGVDRDWPVVIVGIGNLGRALVNSEGFFVAGLPGGRAVRRGPGGSRRKGRPGDRPAPERPRRTGPDRPPGDWRRRHAGLGGPRVADALVAVGVTSILNFAPRVLVVPTEVLLRYVDLSIELQVMSFYQSRRADEVEGEVPFMRSVGLSPSPDIG